MDLPQDQHKSDTADPHGIACRDRVIIWLNGSKRVLRDVEPQTTLLQFLRSVGLSGTKLGCGEGGCGACTVTASSYRAKDDTVVHRAVNACITPVCAMDCCSITTVEGIGSSRSTLHPVQVSVSEQHCKT
jgi:xanthine dehydrogenase/oxidase